MNRKGDSKEYYIFPSVPTAEPLSSTPTLGEVGGKALSLYENSADFPVPPGLVLTVAFFQPWLERIKETEAWDTYVQKQVASQAHNRSDCEVTKEDCDAIKLECEKVLSIDEEQTNALKRAIKEAFGPEADPSNNLGIVAVRSSSPEEDLAGSSFAGGYETSLGVTSEKLHGAIIHSFASMFDHRIHLYKIQNGMAAIDPKIAVVIQRQIASDVSGVAFSLNPSNNCYDEIAISANFGLGESVVGGIVTPDMYVVDRFDPKEAKIASKKVANKASSVWLNADTGGTREEENKEGKAEAQALTDEQILEVADLVARVEEEKGEGVPVDIEWAICDGKLYLLQARPVTAYIPLFPEMITPRGEEKKLYLDIMVTTQGFSDPMSVLGLDLWGKIVARIKSTMSTEGREGLVWNLHGRQYIQISNWLMMTGGSAMINKFRTYDKAIDRSLDSIDMGNYTPACVPEGAKGILWKTLSEVWSMLPNMLRGLYKGDQAMEEYIVGSNAIMEKCYDDECPKDQPFDEALEDLIVEFTALMPLVGGMLAGLISRAVLHNWTFSKREDARDKLINLCMDLKGNPTSEMGHAMVRLASYPEIQETASGEDFLTRLKEGSFSEEFLADYGEYLRRFGCRGMREIDAATPRTHEDQTGLFDALRAIDVENNQIINVRERRDVAYKELLEIARDIGREKQFVHHAGVVQSLMGYREHPKFLLVAIVARMRRHALNIAEDFVARGRLEDADQIFALTVGQVAAAQKDADMDLTSLVKANMEPIQRVSHVKNWPKLIDSRGRIIRGARPTDVDVEEGTMLGDPISPGTVRGRAKVLMLPYEKPLESGEVLVARFTEPSWTPLFINAAGVVMEIGGPMQHGAIIAREYGIPCVSGLDDATKLIQDGDLLEVDGSSGVVRIVDEETGCDTDT